MEVNSGRVANWQWTAQFDQHNDQKLSPATARVHVIKSRV